MKNKSDFYITTHENNELHVTLLGYVKFEERVYVVTTPYDDVIDDYEYQDFRIAVFLLSYVNKKPNFYLINDEELCEAIFEKFAEQVVNENQ